jgi:nitroreductase
MQKPAETSLPILDVIRDRWSPVAFSDRAIELETISTLLEAMRWAPSCFNEQPWRLLVTQKGDARHEKLLGTLVDANAAWAQQAAVLLLACAKTTFTRNGAPNRHAGYDLGMGIAHLSLQATAMGLFLHQMGGFDAEAARRHLELGDDIEPYAVIALGYPGEVAALPEGLRTRQQSPRQRNAVADWLL